MGKLKMKQVPRRLLLLLLLAPACAAAAPPAAPAPDPPWIPNGDVLRSGGYSCQPYCAVMPDDGSWVCVMTFIRAPIWIEGQPGEHMVSMRTRDEGKTWTGFNAIEPYSNATTGQVSAYGSVAARADGSRVFALWIQNVHNVSHLPGEPPAPAAFRADMLGNFVWKFSDDRGETWSARHYTIPVPYTYIESVNSFSKAKNGTGDVQIMWEVDHLKTLKDGTLVFAFTKIGTYAVAAPEELFILASSNLLTEEDPDKVVWDMWPHGEHGIMATDHPDDPTVVAEEPHVVPVHSDDMLTLFWRTTQGYMGHATSQRGGPAQFAKPWATSTFASYLPTWADGYQNASWLKPPRGPLSPKRQDNGQVLMTYYNTAPLGAAFTHLKISDRNMMWLTAGHDVAEGLCWTQPELILYERQRDRGHGYPDIVAAKSGETYITETFKASPQSEAKTHKVPKAMLALLYRQTSLNETATDGVVASFDGKTVVALNDAAGALPDFQTYPKDRYGFSVDIWLDATYATQEQTVLLGASSSAAAAAAAAAVGGASDGDGDTHTGVSISYFSSNGTVMVDMVDTMGSRVRFGTDPVCSQWLKDGQQSTHHVGVLVDAGPKMIAFVVDGKLCDGGPDLKTWANGHHLFDLAFGDVGGATTGSVRVATDMVVGGRWYDRVLYVTEMIGNWRAGK